MPTWNAPRFSLSSAFSTGPAPESLRMCTETSAECPSGARATGRASRTSPVARSAASNRFPKPRNSGESTVYRLDVTTITSCFSPATTPGNDWAITFFALVDSGLPSTFPCELSPCRAVATRPRATTTATPQNASVRRGRAAHARARRSVEPMTGFLLHRDGLRQIARLIDVEAAQPRDAIGEELERDHRERRLEEVRRPRHVDHVVGVVLDVLVAVGRDRDHVRAACARLLDVRDDLVVRVDVRRDHDDGRALVEHRDRPVLHLAGRVRVGRDVRDLLQLQRAFERDGQADVPPEVEEERLVVEALGDRLDRVVALEELPPFLRPPRA